MDGISWRIKYLHPSTLSFASGANLVGYLYNQTNTGLIILSAICMATAVWVVCGNIEDDKNGI